jgi:hypothetical protein
MQNFISTETVVLLSLLGKKMPNLFKYIIQYSTPQSAKKVELKLTKSVSAQQIQEARKHPSGLISQTLVTVTTIQNLLNVTSKKIQELLEQRSAIENTLITLLSINNK